MSLRFILGGAGSGKTYSCFEEIKSNLLREREEPSLCHSLFLCPEQSTFQMEIDLIKHLGTKGLLGARVVSFERLSWWILREVGGITKEFVDDIGVKMIIRRILEENKNNLKVFSNQGRNPGFIDNLFDLHKEFKNHRITKELLKTALENISKGMLKDKLEDFYTIFQGLETYLGNKLTGNDKLEILAKQLLASYNFRNCDVWIDGFHGFTPQEYNVIASIMKISRTTSISLCLPPKYSKIPPKRDDAFFHLWETMDKLLTLGKSNSVKLGESVFLNEKKRFLSREFIHIEKNLYRYPTIKEVNTGGIEIISAGTREDEVTFAAMESIKLCRDWGYRWRDIGIIVRDIENYKSLLQRTFDLYDIPLFIDGKRDVAHHPLMELIRSLFEIASKGLLYEPVLRYLKTDLVVDVTRDQVDLLENYVLEYGIKGKKWIEDSPWNYYKKSMGEDLGKPSEKEEEFLERINSIRYKGTRILKEFYNQLNRGSSVEDICDLIIKTIDSLDIEKTLEDWKKEENRKGNLVKAQEHQQVYQEFLNLIAQVKEILGDQRIPFDDLSKVISSGLEGIRLGIIPQGLDQISVGNLDRSRNPEVKIIFLLGVNEGILPKKVSDRGLLSDDDRITLLERGKLILANDSRSKAFHEQFVIYQALTRASEKLYITFARADEEGKTLLPSSLVARIMELTPNIAVKKAEEILLTPPLVGHWDYGLKKLSTTVRVSKTEKISSFWIDTYNWLQKNKGEKLQLVIDGLKYQNSENPISSETVAAIYGNRIKTSVSRLERFNMCPFAHFLMTGLKLKGRRIQRVEAPDLGELFHMSVYKTSKKIKDEKLDWKNLTKDDCNTIASNIIDELAPLVQNEALISTPRLKYLLRKLKRTVKTALWLISEHGKMGEYESIGLEIGFGSGEELPPLLIDLDGEGTMEISGRIDRVDLIKTQKGNFLRVIDYKSGTSSLELYEIFYGLKMQLLLYLDVVLTYGEMLAKAPCSPGGFMYFDIRAPLLPWDSSAVEGDVDTELMKKLKLKGMVLKDIDLIKTLDKDLQGHSKILPLGLKNDESFHPYSKIFSDKDYLRLRDHVRTIIKKIGLAILKGDVSISPCKIEAKKACDYCDYLSVCQFDPSFEGNKYRLLNKEKGKGLIDREGGDGIAR
jgi:ATP-dependent helicase/nuclease subunit B